MLVISIDALEQARIQTPAGDIIIRYSRPRMTSTATGSRVCVGAIIAIDAPREMRITREPTPAGWMEGGR